MNLRSLQVRPDMIEQVKLAVRTGRVGSQRVLAEMANVSLATVSNFLNGKPVDSQNFINICQKLALNWQELVNLYSDTASKNLSVSPNFSSVEENTKIESVASQYSEILVTLFKNIYPALRNITGYVNESHIAEHATKLAIAALSEAKDYRIGGISTSVIPNNADSSSVTPKIQKDFGRADALIRIVPHMLEVLPEALEASRSIQDNYFRAKALIRLASYLPEVLPEALESARNIQDNYSRAKILSELIAFLPEVKLEALEAARNI